MAVISVKSLLVSSFLVLLFVVSQTRVDAACEKKDEFSDLEGFCYVRGEDDCNATEFRQGCTGGAGCALCVQNTSICLEKPVCSDANGECVKNLTDCDRLINERHCHGDGCACCKDGCERKDKCKELDGYCLLKEQYKLCNGTQFNKGCDGKDCFCCVPDTSKCIEKVGCLNANGACLKQGNWTDCDNEIDSFFCLGDDCACCREKACLRSDACAAAGGYCFRKKTDSSKSHVCNGQEGTQDCGSDSCTCCIPS